MVSCVVLEIPSLVLPDLLWRFDYSEEMRTFRIIARQDVLPFMP